VSCRVVLRDAPLLRVPVLGVGVWVWVRCLGGLGIWGEFLSFCFLLCVLCFVFFVLGFVF